MSFNSRLSGVMGARYRGVFGGTSGSGPTPTCWPEPIAPCSTDTERYLWIMDGQDDFWLRSDTWSCVNPTVEISFIGRVTSGTYMLFDGDETGVDRAFAFINGNTGYVNSPNAQTIELNGVEVVGNTNASRPVEGKENLLKITFVGNFRVRAVGCRFMVDTAFCRTPITAIKLTDPANEENTHTTKFTGNERYQLEVGGTSGNSTTFYRENEEVDGSDIVPITRLPDPATGWEDVETLWVAGETTDVGNANAVSPTSIMINETSSELAGVYVNTPANNATIRVSGRAFMTSGVVDVSVAPNLSGKVASISESGPFSFELSSLGSIGFKRAFGGGAVALLTEIKVVTLRPYAEGALNE